MFAGLGNSYCHALLLSYKMPQELKQPYSQIPRIGDFFVAE